MHLTLLAERIEQLATAGLLRLPDDEILRARLGVRFGSALLDLSSNDYLGLRGAPLPGGAVSRETPFPASPDEGSDVSRETSREWGAGSSRLLNGTTPEHLEVEAAVARWVGQPAALLFASGYAANVGALSALIDPDDCVVSDTLNHASIIDGIRLSRARPNIVPHLDLAEVERALQEGRAAPARWGGHRELLLDGRRRTRLGRAPCSVRPLRCPPLRRRSARFGRIRAPGSRPPSGRRGSGGSGHGGLWQGGGRAGGVCLCVVTRPHVALESGSLVRVFDGSIPGARRGLVAQIHRTKDAGPARGRLAEVSRALRAGLSAQGWSLPLASFGPIVSLLVGTPARALELSAELEKEGRSRPGHPPADGARWGLTNPADVALAAPGGAGRAAAPPHCALRPNRPDRRGGGMKRLVLLGTGTGVGKTYVGAQLVRAWRERGHPAWGLKPIESGVAAGSEASSDASQLRGVGARIARRAPLSGPRAGALSPSGGSAERDGDFAPERGGLGEEIRELVNSTT